MDTTLLGTNAVTVQVITPTHIGTGEKLQNFDYVRDGSDVVVLDQDKLMRWVSNQANEQLALTWADLVAKNASITSFLQQHGQSPEAMAAYHLKSVTSAKVKELMPFIKTPDHRPYLPGSSLKGSLRSALLRGALLADPALRSQVDRLVKEAANPRRSPSEAVQAAAFVPALRDSDKDLPRSKFSNYDLNRLLALGDSRPVTAASALQVVEIQTLSSTGPGKSPKLNPKNYSLFAEALRAGARLSLSLRWNAYLLDERAANLKLKSLQQFMLFLPEYCRAASLELINQEIKFYGQHGDTGLRAWYENLREQLLSRPENIFFVSLGWGSGYDPKTVTDLLDTSTYKQVVDTYRNTSGLGRPGNVKANAWLGPEFSPKSRKVVVTGTEERLPLGWLAVSIKPSENDVGEWWTDMRERYRDLKPIFPQLVKPRVTLASAASTQEPVAPTASESPQKPPEPSPATSVAKPTQKLLTPTFTNLPEVGDRFRGRIIDSEPSGKLYVEIPGLSPDEIALAVVSPENNPERRKFKEGAEITCEVLALTPDPGQKGLMLVECRRE